MKRILTPLMSIANSMKTLGLIVRSSIPSGADLNDYVNPGTFFCGSGTIAAALTLILGSNLWCGMLMEEHRQVT